MNIIEYYHRWVICSLPKHSGQYMVMQVNIERKTLLIQKPEETKAHWVNVRFCKIVGE